MTLAKGLFMKRDNKSRHASAVNAALQINWTLTSGKRKILSEEELATLAESYLEMFLPYFTNQKEGSINPDITLQLSAKMKQKLGLAFLFEHKIRLNFSYFRKDPSLLPYTLFHEMTHIWLYDCMLDPGHTQRFYNKMAEFQATGLAVDPDVHVHRRIAPEGKFVYICPNCSNRWFMRDRLKYSIYCGHCFDREGIEYIARRLRSPKAGSSGSGNVDAA